MGKIESESEKQRLDKYLSELYPDKSRVWWKNRIENGFVIVGGKKVKPTHKIKMEDKITILPDRENETKKASKREQNIPKIDVIYEDKNVIVLDKPASIPVHEAASHKGPTVVDFLVNHFPAIKIVGEDPKRPGIVHRLDKDTSGVLIAAKTNDSFEFLKNQFKQRHARKAYTALVCGELPDESGVIDLKIGRSKADPTMQTVIDSKRKEGIKSREAITLYHVKKRYKSFTLLEIVPKTGRMHQIRVHLKALGFPVVGDKKYFMKKYAKIEPRLERQFLHASLLEIEIPELGLKKFESPLSKDLSAFLDKLNL